MLAVQNRTRRNYAEEEVETLQTVAMVLAEMVAGGELISPDELLPADGDALLPLRVAGIRLNPGRGMGVAVVHQPHYNVRRLVAENPDHEHDRLLSAVADMHGALDDMLKATDLAAGGEPRDILETYRMIAEDAGWLARMDEAISSGLTAEAAVQKVHNDIRARMSKVTDPYLHERLHDLEDLADRLLHHLIGGEESAPPNNLPPEVILVARTMGPAQLLDYDRTSLRGLVLRRARRRLMWRLSRAPSTFRSSVRRATCSAKSNPVIRSWSTATTGWSLSAPARTWCKCFKNPSRRAAAAGPPTRRFATCRR